MTSKWETVLSSLHHSAQLASFVIDKQNIVYTTHQHIDNKIILSEHIQLLMERCKEKQTTYISISALHLAVAGMYVQESGEIILLGPVFLGSKSEKQVYKDLTEKYKLKEASDIMYLNSLPEFSQSNFIGILNFLNCYMNGVTLCVDKEHIFMQEEDEQNLFEYQNANQDMAYDVTTDKQVDAYENYLFEQRIMECIRSGDKERLLNYQRYDSIVRAGKYSNQNDLIRQRKNEFICACTLATRAAIQGGLSVEQAYSLGDRYILRIEGIQSAEKLQNAVGQMFIDFTVRVASVIKANTYSSITTACMNYVYEHVYNDLSAQSIADAINTSKNHMLTKFKKETGISLVDFIKKAKVAEAKLMLEYSETPIIEISEALSCSSQSFFTTMFHQIEGTTPKQYREAKKSQRN